MKWSQREELIAIRKYDGSSHSVAVILEEVNKLHPDSPRGRNNVTHKLRALRESGKIRITPDSSVLNTKSHRYAYQTT